MPKLKNKIALITGATQGLGAAIAKKFAQEGAHLILLGRTVEGLEAIDDEISVYGVKTTLVPVELKDLSKLEALGPSLIKQYPSIDIFVGNAATLGQLSPLTHLSPPVWQEVLTVNLTANFYLLRSLEPLLRKSSAPRVIFVSTGVARSHLPYWGIYAISKAALESMALIYAAENKETSLKVNIVDPGVMRTRLFHQAMPGINLEDVPLPETVTDCFVYLASDECQETGQLVKGKEFQISRRMKEES